MADFPPLRYWLPKTVFTVTVHTGKEIVQQEAVADGKAVMRSYLKSTADLTVAPKIVPDHRAKAITVVKQGILESFSCEVQLDDNGVIESIGTSSSRDITPVINLAAKLVQFVPGVRLLGVPVTAESAVEKELAEPGTCLEDLWIARFPSQAGLLDGLSDRMQDLLEQLAKAEAEAIPGIGTALTVVERELGALDRMRRDWIASRATTNSPTSWEFDTEDLILQQETPNFPGKLGRDVVISDLQRELVEQAGLLLVLGGRLGKAPVTHLGYLDLTDALVFRRPRSMTLGVYTRENEDQDWTRDPGRDTVIDVLDLNCEINEVTFDGSWIEKNTIKLDFHPDGSMKTYSVSSSPALSDIATAAGGLADAVATARKERKPAEDPKAKALAEAKTQLDLLKTSSEYAQLAATHGSAAELAELEQRVRLAELRQKI